MVVLVLTAVPVGLRGFVTRWLLEISAGVFVGRVSKRIRVALWERIMEMVKDGRAIMVFTDDSEQRFGFLVHRHDWEVVDCEGVNLIRRPVDQSAPVSPMRQGWSKASRIRRRPRG